MHDATTMTNNNINKVGIITFEARSMPSRTPFSMIRYVNPSMITVHSTGFMGSLLRLAKYSWKYSGEPVMWPMSDAQIYCPHHPATTA